MFHLQDRSYAPRGLSGDDVFGVHIFGVGSDGMERADGNNWMSYSWFWSGGNTIPFLLSLGEVRLLPPRSMTQGLLIGSYRSDYRLCAWRTRQALPWLFVSIILYAVSNTVDRTLQPLVDRFESASAENNNPSPMKLCHGPAGFDGSDKIIFSGKSSSITNQR